MAQALTNFSDRYRPIERLGRGNFGEVWRCHDEHQDEIVAVKVFKAGVRLDAVLTEAQLQSRLSGHDHVVTVRNVITEPPFPLVAMDFLSGGSVGARLQQDNVPLVDAVGWVRDALSGLGHAHSMGILHRDIKPGNILLDANGRARISDFGIAEDTLRRYRAQDIDYLPHRAPELVLGEGGSAQSDVWSMGCTLYRLLAGHYPFPDDAAIRTGAVTPVHRANPQVPMSLSRVVNKALATRLSDRFPDAREMLAALTRCRVLNSWRREHRGTRAVWVCDTATESLEVSTAPVATGFRLIARRDLGKGFRQLKQAAHASLPGAQREERRWLVGVVEGKHLRDIWLFRSKCGGVGSD